MGVPRFAQMAFLNWLYSHHQVVLLGLNLRGFGVTRECDSVLFCLARETYKIGDTYDDV